MTIHPVSNIRNPVKCRRCDTPLLVECLRVRDREPGSLQKFSFICPACFGWNADVPLHGCEVMTVIRDPRQHDRGRPDHTP